MDALDTNRAQICLLLKASIFILFDSYLWKVPKLGLKLPKMPNLALKAGTIYLYLKIFFLSLINYHREDI